MDSSVALALVLKSTFFHVVGAAGEEESPAVSSAKRGSRASSQPSLRRSSTSGPLYINDGSNPGWLKVGELEAADCPAVSSATGSPPPSPGSSCCPLTRRSRRSISSMSTASSESGDAAQELRQLPERHRHQDPRAAQAPTDPSAPARDPAHAGSEKLAWTTVMMRNLPTSYVRQDLCNLLASEGFAGRFNFLYLPHDFRTGTCAGFAFVNLLTEADALRFREHFGRFKQWGVPSHKACNVSWANADQQGLECNVERYRNSSVMHKSVPEACKPMLLEGGKQVPFPKSTKKLWPPSESFGIRANRRHS